MFKLTAATSNSQLKNLGFVQPHFIPELGAEGLTASEIARSLNVPIENIHKKLRLNQWHSGQVPEFTPLPYEVVIDSGTYAEREGESYALSTVAAQAFVARWKSEVGDAYLLFLIRCSKAVETLLKERVANAEAKALPREKISTLPAPEYFTDSEGVEHERYYLKETSRMGLIEILQLMNLHSEKCIEGIRKTIAKRSGYIDRLILGNERVSNILDGKTIIKLCKKLDRNIL